MGQRAGGGAVMLQCVEPAVSLTVCGRGWGCSVFGEGYGWRLETGHLLSVWDRINRKRLSEREKGAEDPLVSPGPLYIFSAVFFKHPLKIAVQFPYFLLSANSPN